MKVDKLVLGRWETNGYIVSNEAGDCVVIDPGDWPERVAQIIDNNKLNLKGILITHSHFDHISGVDALVEKYGVDVYAHKKEAAMMADFTKNLSKLFLGKAIQATATRYLEDGEEISFGDGLEFQVIEVPGHTENSLCYYHNAILFSGDTLFKETVGRIDLYPGHQGDLIAYIKKRLLVLPDKTLVYPGHGESTTIGYEKANNMFLNY